MNTLSSSAVMHMDNYPSNTSANAHIRGCVTFRFVRLASMGYASESEGVLSAYFPSGSEYRR